MGFCSKRMGENGVCRASASVGGTSDIEGWLFITEVCPVGGGRAEAA